MTAERDRAVARTQAAVLHLDRVVRAVAEVDQPDAFVEVPAYPGSPQLADYTRLVPRPLVGIAAARVVEQVARREVGRYVRAAREAGHGWEQIGAALGLERAASAAGVSLGEAAHNWAVTGAADGQGPNRPRDTYDTGAWAVVWRCPACDGLVRDYGPVEGHPADCEPGHARGCTRLADDVARHRVAWGMEVD